MRLILFGASGMVGAGVLAEALAAPGVEAVLSIGRKTSGVAHPKLRELVVADIFDVDSVADRLSGYDACIWAIGISSVGLDEATYAQVTEKLTIRWATALLRLNPGMAFCYCSAAGAGGHSMWARVRQRVEGALGSMGFRYAGAVRPAFIRPGPGIRSRTRLNQAGLVLMRPFYPLYPLVMRSLPSLFTTSERLGRAMLRVVEGKAGQFILESADINRIGS